MMRKVILFFFIALLSIGVASRLRVHDTETLHKITWNVLGVLVGTGVAAAVFFTQAVEGIRRRAIVSLRRTKRMTKKGEEHLNARLDNATDKVMYEAMAQLICVGLLLLLGIANDMDLPYVEWPRSLLLTKCQAIYSLAFIAWSTIFWSVFDCLAAMHQLIRLDREIRKDPKDSDVG